MKIKIKDTIMDGELQHRPEDVAWNGRESEAITFVGTYYEAINLFTNDAEWSVISENPEGEMVEVDMSEFSLAGSITDNRNGTMTAKMGKYLQTEIIAMTIGSAPVTQAQAVSVRTAIETAVQSLDDNAAASVVSLFPVLKQDGSLIKAGTKINWQGKIVKALVDLWDREDHNPDNAPTLWVVL